MSKRVLVGDVGGTNSRWAFFDGELGPVTVTKTRDARSLAEAAEQFLQGRTVDACCVAVAGPVEKGAAKLTNADWVADPSAMHVPTRVLNDLEGAAHGVVALRGESIEWNGSVPQGEERTLVLGVGTGFGGAVLDGDMVRPMEPGHDRFAPEDDAVFCGMVCSTTTVEHLVSGPGLVFMWEHFRRLQSVESDERPADLGAWLVENSRSDALATAVCEAFRTALVHATVTLARRCDVTSIVFMGGVIDGWCRHLAEAGVWDDIGQQAGCSVGRIAHPYPGLVGAGRVGLSLLSH